MIAEIIIRTDKISRGLILNLPIRMNGKPFRKKEFIKKIIRRNPMGTIGERRNNASEKIPSIITMVIMLMVLMKSPIS